ncbi:SGNH/GDSL hydrolase family protein [Stieleria varia]|uniref:SGNH hydrolase-type esterase domain-containing protein n=1 Tax=Stieleria varia TaxID=2528005 RepID=A0A5C6BAY6_9BACT|nr:SGNH/GDSL hydrolase family protein [Stieleria varia]TWU08439.1 hypothetical protein Pla52n_10220 [Stieleria varia]
MAKKSRKRLILLCITAIGLLLFAVFYQRYYVARPIGSGPAGPAVDRAAFANVWSDRPVHVVGLGDSVTAGLGAKSTSHSYFNRVIQNPDDEFEQLHQVCLTSVLPNLTNENYAISGSESTVHFDVITETLPVMDERLYGIVLMTSGGNDLIHMYGKSPPRECAMYGATLEQALPWIENFEARLGEMVSLIDQRFPGGCEIYIGDIYDPTDGTGDAGSIYLSRWPDGLAIHARYNAVIRKVAGQRDNVFVVPLYETFLGHGSQCRKFWRSTFREEDPYFWFYSNIEDPNDRGYDAIRRVFLNTIVANTKLRSE